MQDFGLSSEVVWRLPGGAGVDDAAHGGALEADIAAAEGRTVTAEDGTVTAEDRSVPPEERTATATTTSDGSEGFATHLPLYVSSALDDAGNVPPVYADALRDEGSDHHWSVPWSDLMMVMFVMFAVMTVTEFSRPDEDLPTEEVATRDRVVRPYGEPIMTINVLERAQRVVKDSEADDVDIVLMEDQSVKVSVQGPMLFGPGSAELRPDVTDFLDRLASIIRETPYMIEIVGHTDDRPVSTAVFPSNWELSTARASRVARYLIDSGRLAATRFTVIGRAEYDPVSANASMAARTQNRRVEILITRDVLPSSEIAIRE